ncbi:MAG: DUF2202 domain-containing protein [Prolixibacteraceae bacterium]|nr:DUF2202 domain-containing protein [Prolixibacteraceae bacterium]
MKTRFILLGLAFTAALFTACNDDFNQDFEMVMDEKSAAAEEYYNNPVFTTTVEDLTKSDIEGLLFMREEELLAHDVYAYFFEKYGLTIFERITESESKHSEAVLLLLNHFELDDPATGEAGVYSNEDLQTLYNDLIAMGDESVEAALTVGGLIEETDIQDLDNQIESTENADIIRVYSNLLDGSYNHLKAFVRTLEYYGVTYEPTVLDQEYFEEILAMVGNGQGAGQGNGFGNKGGNGNGNGQSGSNGNGQNGSNGNGQGGSNGNGGKGGK